MIPVNTPKNPTREPLLHESNISTVYTEHNHAFLLETQRGLASRPWKSEHTENQGSLSPYLTMGWWLSLRKLRLLQRELKEWIIYTLLLLGQNWTCIGKWFASKKSKVNFQLKLLDLHYNKNWGDKCRRAQKSSHYLQCSWLEWICQLSGICLYVKHNHIDQLTHQLKFYGIRRKRMWVLVKMEACAETHCFLAQPNEG